MSALPSATQSVTPLPATVSHSCSAALHHCAVYRAKMRSPEPLPGTLVRTPSAFGDFAVSQTFTVAQNGR
jgi:hypothetical protein